MQFAYMLLTKNNDLYDASGFLYEAQGISFSYQKLVITYSSLNRIMDYIPETNNSTIIVGATEDLYELFTNELNSGEKKYNLMRMSPLQLETFLDKIESLQAQLNLIKIKENDLKNRGYEKAAYQANTFHHTVSSELSNFLQSPTAENFKSFKDKVQTAYVQASPDLGTHRGYKQLLGNVLLAILGLGVFYGIAVWKNGGFFFKTDSMEKIDSAIKICNSLDVFSL